MLQLLLLLWHNSLQLYAPLRSDRLKRERTERKEEESQPQSQAEVALSMRITIKRNDF